MENTIEINGTKYKKVEEMSESFVIVRSRDSGVHAGYLSRRTGAEVELLDAIRLWYWDGAFTLSQLAMEGVKKPETCKFAMPVYNITVLGVCEVIHTTEAARKSIQSVTPCKQ